MNTLRDAQAVRHWLDSLGVEQVVAISPHLDDAVYSIAGILRAAGARAEVITLFTEGLPGDASAWARATGFADAAEEHAARRSEDMQAMNRLGCRFQHAGLRAGQTSDAAARRLRLAIEQGPPGSAEHTLVLLPAGTGSPPPRSALLKLALRGLRRPSGAVPHGEHIEVRNSFWQALWRTGVRVGFYAELPYAWSRSNAQMQQDLHLALGCVTEAVVHHPDIEDKRQLIELYRSQLVPVMGKRAAYRRRVISRGECLCLATAAPPCAAP